MSITMTSAAARHIKGQLKIRGKGIGIRVGVKTSGCSGMRYTIEFVDTQLDNDQVFINNDVHIYADPKDLVYLEGTELDLAIEGLNEGLQFRNPNATSECGCGESFNV